MVEKRGNPKRDGSGKGERANRGRGGCDPPRDAGLAKSPSRGKRRWF